MGEQITADGPEQRHNSYGCVWLAEERSKVQKKRSRWGVDIEAINLRNTGTGVKSRTGIH